MDLKINHFPESRRRREDKTTRTAYEVTNELGWIGKYGGLVERDLDLIRQDKKPPELD